MGRLSPMVLWWTIIGILVGHYIFLGTQLGLCTWVAKEEAENLLKIQEKTGKPLDSSDFTVANPPCKDLADDFRNARNKAIEITLALLVPAGAHGVSVASEQRGRGTAPIDKPQD